MQIETIVSLVAITIFNICGWIITIRLANKLYRENQKLDKDRIKREMILKACDQILKKISDNKAVIRGFQNRLQSFKIVDLHEVKKMGSEDVPKWDKETEFVYKQFYRIQLLFNELTEYIKSRKMILQGLDEKVDHLERIFKDINYCHTELMIPIIETGFMIMERIYSDFSIKEIEGKIDYLNEILEQLICILNDMSTYIQNKFLDEMLL